MSAESLLFVYGTLLRGQPNHSVLGGAAFLGPIRTAASYTLHSLGPYPALRAGGQTAIPGELYALSPVLQGVLDRFEDHPDLYERGTVLLEDGRVACAYLMPPDRAVDAPVIPHWPPH